MQKLQIPMGEATFLKQKKLLGMSIGLLCLEPVSAALAHGGGGFMPIMTPTAPVHNTALAGKNSLFMSQDVGKSHGTVPLVTSIPGHTKLSTLMPVTHHKANVGTAPTFVSTKTSAFITEAGQAGQTLSLDLTSTSTAIMLGSNLFGGRQSVTID